MSSALQPLTILLLLNIEAVSVGVRICLKQVSVCTKHRDYRILGS